MKKSTNRDEDRPLQQKKGDSKRPKKKKQARMENT